MSAEPDTSTASDENDTALIGSMDRGAVLDSVEPATVKTVVKLSLGIVALVFLLALVSVLPGLDRLVLATPITFAALVVALVTLGIVAVLLYVAPQLASLVEQGFAGPEDLTTNVAAVVQYLVVLLAVLVAYRGLADAIVPFLVDTNSVWAYDLSFLVLALIPIALIARHLYRGLDPAADLLTQKVTTTAGPAAGAAVEPAGSETDSADSATDESETDDTAA